MMFKSRWDCTLSTFSAGMYNVCVRCWLLSWWCQVCRQENGGIVCVNACCRPFFLTKLLEILACMTARFACLWISSFFLVFPSLAQLLSCLTALSPHLTISCVCACLLCLCVKSGSISSRGIWLYWLDNPSPDKTNGAVRELHRGIFQDIFKDCFCLI